MSVQSILNEFIRAGIRLSFSLRFIWNGSIGYKMKLSIIRREFTDKSTIGELLMDGDLFCYTLERSSRESGEAPLAIPAGRYKITLYNSPHLGYEVPLLEGVPGRTFIEIHPANYPSELLGCIAPGMRKGLDMVYDSRNAFGKVLAEIKKQVQFGDVYIDISGGRNV